jgi:hypothetical protein
LMRLAQQQLSSSAARATRANSWLPLSHLLVSVQQLLNCWHELVGRVPELLPVVVRTLLPLVQQLQGCGSLLMRPAAAASSAPAGNLQFGSSSSSCADDLQSALFGVHSAASLLLKAIDGQKQLDAGVAAEALGLQMDPAVAELQLQLLIAWAAQLHKQHTAQQQQLPSGTAGAISSSTQQRQQPAKQQHRADLLSIPAFHQDMLQLLPGGQGYIDEAAEEAAGWGLEGEAYTVQLRAYAGCCCQTIGHLYRRLQSTGQQDISRYAHVLSCAAVRLLLELQLLAAGAVQRQREQHRQQRQQGFTPDQASTDRFALQTWALLKLQIQQLSASSRSCLLPELLHQAGLQLLQALAAPLQQCQLSESGDSFLQTAAAAGALSYFGETLQLLMTAACGAQAIHGQEQSGEHG